MERSFSTPDPTTLFVEIGSGSVRVEAAETDTTTVRVSGEAGDEATVEQRDDRIVVVAPTRVAGLFGGHRDLDVHVRLPRLSRLVTKLGSADLSTTGTLGDLSLKSGSGDIRIEAVEGDGVVSTGSGDLSIGSATGDLRTSTGSGEVELGDLGAEAAVTTGSGSVRVGSVSGALAVKTGSGDLQVLDAGGDATLRTGSGRVEVRRAHRGQLTARTGSGDIRVGVPAGVPVWTDISTGTGQVHSDLDGAGEPAEGQEFLELRAKTGSGSVHLQQV